MRIKILSRGATADFVSARIGTMNKTRRLNQVTKRENFFIKSLCSVMKLMLFANFCQALFDIAFWRERVGVGAPKFFRHLARWNERAL